MTAYPLATFRPFFLLDGLYWEPSPSQARRKEVDTKITKIFPHRCFDRKNTFAKTNLLAILFITNMKQILIYSQEEEMLHKNYH